MTTPTCPGGATGAPLMKGPGVEHGPPAAQQMCGLSAFQNDYTKEELQKLYGNKKTYKSKFEKRLSELEKGGWSLPVYHEMIMSDVARVDF